jgi:hypothetical protein
LVKARTKFENSAGVFRIDAMHNISPERPMKKLADRR